MKKSSKLVLAALALGLVPFELKAGKDGDFSYQSLLIGLSSGKNEEGKRNLTLNLFNLPDFLKKKPAEETSNAQAEEAMEPDAEEPAAEAPGLPPESQDIPAQPSL